MASHVLAVLIATLPVFIIVLLGVGLRKWNIIDKSVDTGITKLLLNVVMPCFILYNIIGSAVASDIGKVSLLAAIGAGIIVCSLGITYAISPFLGMGKGSGRRSFSVATGLQNYGYMAVPLIMSLYADSELLATLFLHSLGVELAIFTVGIMIFSGKISFSPKVLLKGPVIAVFLGVFLNVTQLATHIPDPLVTSISWLGATAVPLGLIAVGMSIGEVLPETKYSLKVSFSAIFIRLILLPAFIISIAYLLPVDDMIKKVLLIQAAMPAALFPIILARHYGGKPALVAEVAIMTSIASFVTMPLVIVAGTWLLGF